MSIAPAYVGERDLSGRQPPYIGPIISVNTNIDPGSQHDFYGAYIWDQTSYAYLQVRCIPATLANEEVAVWLYGDNGQGGWFEVDFWDSLPVAQPYQTPRTIIVPPVQLRLHVINFGATQYAFAASLLPELPPKGR